MNSEDKMKALCAGRIICTNGISGDILEHRLEDGEFKFRSWEDQKWESCTGQRIFDSGENWWIKDEFTFKFEDAVKAMKKGKKACNKVNPEYIYHIKDGEIYDVESKLMGSLNLSEIEAKWKVFE